MKTFLFDIGHVLVDFKTQDFLRELSASVGRQIEVLDAVGLEKINDVEKGTISDAEYVDYLNRTHGTVWDTDELIAAWARMFSLNEFGRSLFETARASEAQVYTLSNIAAHHMKAIESNWAGFFDGADGLFLSYLIGARKPDPAIYRHAIDALGVPPEDCFFIDDRPENIDAALAVGINAHQFLPETHTAVERAAAEFFGW